jgi:type I site-specific restriction-modification system R (restriction) subunit
LKDYLKVASGGVMFSTIQKFQPEEGNVYEALSERRNIVVIADEAHRTQYGFTAKAMPPLPPETVNDYGKLPDAYLGEQNPVLSLLEKQALEIGNQSRHRPLAARTGGHRARCQ